MKVNIITQPLFSNYGGILQNYALQNVILQLGHEVLTVNVPVRKIDGKPELRSYVRSILNLIARFRGCYDYPFLNPHTFAIKERELSFPQREFIAKHISTIDCKLPFKPELCKEYPADLWIVGSDQVWRPWCSPNIENYFFDFLDDSTRRIAYAASFGTDLWEISPDLTPKIAAHAKKFHAISVREQSGIELCRKHLGIEARQLLDPTMLLTADDYLALTSDSDYPHEEYIATYILDGNKNNKATVKAETDRLGIREVKIGRMHKDRFDSIESWLATLAHAKCVITDSFHGTVFSIIFGKPVKILKNNLRGNARLDSLMAMLELVPDNQGFCYPNGRCADRLMAERQKAIDFLKDALN